MTCRERHLLAVAIGLSAALVVNVAVRLARGDELIEGPATVPIGSLVVLTTTAGEGEATLWMVADPIDLVYKTYGSDFVCSAGCVVGRMVINCAIINWEAKSVRQDRHIVTIGKPEPGPGPEPDPEPDPDPPPTPTGFASKVESALSKVPTASQTIAEKIGANYRQVATAAKTNPGAYNPAAMLDQVKTLNASVMNVQQLTDWRPFFSELAKAFLSLKLESTDLQGHVLAFDQVADVLER